MGDRRDGLLHEIFHVLDQKQRGFVSKVELSHILDAMQADAGGGRLPIPEGLSPRKIQRDCRVNLQDMSGWLEELSVTDLEDVKWFAESVVKVETELRDLWADALRRWRDDLLLLQSRDLHRYLFTSQPPRVARWLRLRDQTPGLGFTQHEVETLFAANTAEEINGYHQEMQPFLNALDLRRQLEFSGSPAEQLASLKDLQSLAVTPELASLLIHEDTLGVATKSTGKRSVHFTNEVMAEASLLIMTLLSHNFHLRCEHPKCQNVLSSFLEIGYDPDHPPELPKAPPVTSPRSRASIGGGRSSLPVPVVPATISTWVENLVTADQDLDRGDMVDKLIKYDEQRLAQENGAVAESLFSHGRTIPVLLGRLNLTSHYTLHERRTPLRTHLLKFLLNILCSSGERGRRLFRSATGMQTLSAVLRGDSWGEPREERPLGEEDPTDEAEPEWEGLHRPSKYYPGDFIDDKFYGPKDRELAAAFLEYLGSEEVWGEDRLMEEFLHCSQLLEVLCRVPSCRTLLRLVLRQRRFPELLERSASKLAERFVDAQIRPLLSPSLPRLSAPCSFGGLSTPEHREALQAFHRAYMEAETKNCMMRLMSFVYHHLLMAQGADEPAEVDEFSRLLAAHLPHEALPVCMAVFMAPCEAASSGARRPECWYLLRLVQLCQLRSAPLPFVVDLEARLRALCETPGCGDEVLCLSAPVRSSLMQRFPRSTPLELVQSLASLLREFTEPVRGSTRQELQLMAFGRLCFYMPWQKTSQDSAAALWAELGLSDRKLRRAQDMLMQIPPHMLEAPFTGFSHPNCCLLHRESYVSLLQLTLDEQVLAFVYVTGNWMLWANDLKSSALTHCGSVPAYFGLQSTW